jgi:hypothetical protein
MTVLGNRHVGLMWGSCEFNGGWPSPRHPPFHCGQSQGWSTRARRSA